MCTEENTLSLKTVLHFLFIRSIEELQEQNQKLLEVVRDLSDRKEADEKQATELK